MSEYKDMKYPFRPVKCTERELLALEQPIDGYLYFTTDTQKLYLGHNSEAMEMCAAKGFYYGEKEIEYDNSGNQPDPVVDFYEWDIEGGKLPEIDDLILNIGTKDYPDGCFYRVVAINDIDSVRTTRVTLQGTGTGPGPGPVGPGGGATSFSISKVGGQQKYFSKEATKAELGVICHSSDAANYLASVALSLDSTFTNSFLTIHNVNWPLDEPYYVDMVDHLDKVSKGTRIYLQATDKYGTSKDFYYNVSTVSLQLTTSEPELFGVSEDTFDYRCAIGGSQDLTTRTIIYEMFSENGTLVYSLEQELEANQSGNIPKTLNISSVPHGAYTLKVRAEGTKDGTFVPGNELVHKVLRYQESIGQPVFSALVPEKTEQYTDIPVSYLLVFGNSVKEYAVNITLNDKPETTQVITANKIANYTLNFDKQGTYILKFAIPDLGVIYSTTLNVVKYTGVLPVINVDRDDLKLYLTAKGRTNNALDKDEWPDLKQPETLRAKLNNFYYRSVNGWMVDDDNVSYLKVTQNASVVLDSYSPFSTNATTDGLTIELDFMIDGIYDYDTHFIECLSYYGDNTIKTGFVVKGDTFKYYASGKELVSLNLVEGKRIKLSFVIEAKSDEEFPMCYTYLDGIISNVVNYLSTYDFTNNPQKPAYLKINSSGGQINVYGIRIYNAALDEKTVLNNYQATIGSLEEREASYLSNLIRDVYGDIQLEEIEAETYNLQIPYVKITGGYQADKKFGMVKQSSSNKPALPVGKKDYRAIDIEIVYPTTKQNPYFSKYKNFKVTTTFDDPNLNVLNGFGNTPNEGAIMYAQGTSSLEYPVKNLRVKLKGKKFTVRPDIAPVELVTFKADFMESAGAHNTGAANFIDDAYASVDLMTPGQVHYENDKDAGTIVTCIKGHPCVIFWNPGVDENGNELDRNPKNYKYIGKYNFNLDKATPEPFGFVHDPKDPDYGFLHDENGELVYNDKGEKINSIRCFEFLDNNEKVCNFLFDSESTYVDYDVNNPKDSYEINDKTPQERFYSTWYDKRINEDNEIVPGWARGFESRHPEDLIDTHDADELFDLANWLHNLYVQRYGIRQCPHCGLKFTVHSGSTCPLCETAGGDYVVQPDERNALQKFRDEYQNYLDPEFTMAYYLITEALLMADSRVKNMMIATWGKEHRSWTTDAGEKKEVYNYIWYPIFYDMDTMLGLDNIGYVNKLYYQEDTQEDTYNGDEVLWKFVRDALKNELTTYYTTLEQGSNKALTAMTIIPYFNENQATMANETFYNEDAFYKYIDTYRKGYTDHLTGLPVPPGKGTRLYAAQGNRAMMREFFIHNRIRYLSGKYMSTNYQESDRFEFRLTYPKKVEAVPGKELTEIERKTNASIDAVPPSGVFEYTSLKTGYAGVKVGTSTANQKFIGEETHELVVNTSSGSGTETYLFGISNLADIGDLSNKYLYRLEPPEGVNNLKRLILGNHAKDYFNPYWINETEISLVGFRFLEEFNLENCGTFYGGVKFTDSPQIKKILLNGSQVSELILPVGGVLEELRIPSSLTDLNIDSHPTLQADKFTVGYFDYDTNTYVNDYSGLAKISIKNTPIDTYGMISNILLDLDPESRRFEQYCFQGVDWEITDPNDVVIVDNEIKSIKVLDMLSTQFAPYEGLNGHSEALTGKLTINVGDYVINEYALYNTYYKIYPGLEITYISSELQGASSIKFYNSETILGDPYYTVLTDGSATLAKLISEEGPNGIALMPPSKVSDNEWTYSFNGIWTVAETENGSIFKVGENVAQTDFANKTPNKNTTFVANFDRAPRLYKVTLYDDDDKTVLLEAELEWNQDIGVTLSDHYQLTYNYKPYDKSDLNPHHRYAFKGWRSSYDFKSDAKAPTWTTLEGRMISGDFIAYATYEEEDARLVPTDERYFSFENTYPILVEYENDALERGWKINLKQIYRDNYVGKLTIPSKYKDAYISYVGNFNDLAKVTDVYFLEDNRYRGVMDKGFKMEGNTGNSLKNVYLPTNGYLLFLDDSSFQNCYNLENISINGDGKLSDSIEFFGMYAFAAASPGTKSLKVNINELPANTKKIRNSAFYGAGENFVVTTLPVGVKDLSNWCFAYNPNVKIGIFGTETANTGLEAIGNGALYLGGNKDLDVVVLQSVLYLSTDSSFPAFGEYKMKSFTAAGGRTAADFYTYDTKGSPLENKIKLGSFAEAGVPDVQTTEAVQGVMI